MDDNVVNLTYGRCAGQAVVQMAKSKHDRLEYAIKFFVSRAAFDVEQAMYGQGSGAHSCGLAQFLPKVSSCTKLDCQCLRSMCSLFEHCSSGSLRIEL
jgi:hypothetical protein